jgi:hypothetical protein
MARSDTARLNELGQDIEAAKSEETAKKNIMAFLSEIASSSPSAYTEGSPVIYHDDPRNKYSIPKGTPLEKAAKAIMDEAAAQAEEVEYTRDFRCRVEEGAVAIKRTMFKVFGASAHGKPIETFFGKFPPREIQITVGLDNLGRPIEESAPGSEFTLAWLEASLTIGTWSDGEHDGMMRLFVTTKKRNKTALDGFFKLVDEELEHHSIYRNQILTYKGKADGGYDLRYTHLAEDPTIIYTDRVQNRLEVDVWRKLRRRERLVQRGLKPTFKELVFGPVGTGKSASCVTTAIKAKEYGYTVLMVNPTGVSSIAELSRAMNVARMYAPTLLVIEDVDKYFSENMSPDQISSITNLFDGLEKHDGISIIMTTNHVDKVHSKMLRAPRTTGVIKIGYLDQESMEHMVRVVLGEQLDPETNFNLVWNEVKDFGPAFMRSTFDKAVEASILLREDDEQYDDPIIGTEELISAARSFQDHRDLHAEVEASQERTKPTLGEFLMDDVKSFVRKLFNGMTRDYQLEVQTTNEHGYATFKQAGENNK